MFESIKSRTAISRRTGSAWPCLVDGDGLKGCACHRIRLQNDETEPFLYRDDMSERSECEGEGAKSADQVLVMKKDEAEVPGKWSKKNNQTS
jgi:hypothetical protein